MDQTPGKRAAKIERGRRILQRFRADKKQELEPTKLKVEEVQPGSETHLPPQPPQQMPLPQSQPLLSPQRLREQLRAFESSSPLLKDYTPEKIQTANHRETTEAGVVAAAAAFGFDAEQQHCHGDTLDKGPPQLPQTMREHSLSATKQQIVPAPAAPKRSLFSDTPQLIAVSQQTIAAAHRDVGAAAHTPGQSPIHSATASPEKTPFGKPSRIEKQAQALLKHSHDVRRLAAGFFEDNGHFCTPDSSFQTFGQARLGSPLQSTFGNEREMLRTAKSKAVQLAAEISRAVDAYSLCSESVALSNTVLSCSPGASSVAGIGVEDAGAGISGDLRGRSVSPARLAEREGEDLSPLMLRDKLTALSTELHFLKSPAMTQIRKFLSEGGKEREDTCGDEAHAALTQSEKSAVSLTASNREAAQAVIRSWLKTECIEEDEELPDMLTELEAIEGHQRLLNQQVGSVVGLLREREVEADRLRAELAASRSLLQDIEEQRDMAMEFSEKQIRELRAALIEQHQQELRDVEEHALKEVEHAVQELEKEKGRMLKREREQEHDRVREFEEMKAKQTQDEVTALAKQEQREREIMQEQERRARERELAHGEQLKERDESLAKLKDHCAGLEKEQNKTVAELQRLHNHILSLKDRENELLDLLETRDETIRTLEHQKIQKADAHAKELEERDAVVSEKDQELQLSKEKICTMEREICVKDEEVVLKHALLAEKDALLAEKDQTIMAKEEALCEHREAHREADEMQRALEGHVKDSLDLKGQLELNASAMQKLEKQAQKDAARREKELATLKEQLGLYETEIMELERRLKEALDANAQYTHDQSKYKDEVEEVQRGMKEAISQREHQIEDRCRHATHLERHIAELSAEMERNQEALGQKIADQEQRIAQLQEEKSQHLALANRLTAAIEEKVSDIAHLNQTISSRDEDIGQLNTLVETYSTQIATRDRERDAALAERESTMVATKQALVQLEAELRGKAAKIDEMEAEASSRNEELFVVRAEMSELAMELSNATEALEKEREDAQERLGAKETQLADLKTELQTLMAQDEVLKTKLSVVHCEFGMTKEELEKTKNQVCSITAALDKANKERDSGAQALESINQERNTTLKEKDREVILRTEETTVLKEKCAKILQEREAALLQVSQFAQQLAAREKEKEIQKVLRSENKRLVAELKATAEKLALQEGKNKQQSATLKTRNDEIIKLSKVLRAAENNLALGAAAATGTGDTTTPTKKCGNPLATVRKHGRGGGEGGDEEILRDQIEELMNSVAGLEGKIQVEMERGQQMEEELLTRQHELHACKREVETCRQQSGLARQIEGDLRAAIAALQEQLRKLESERTSFEQENRILNQRASALEQKVSDLGERLTSSEKLCNTLEDHLSEARTSAAQETALAGRSEQLWKSVAELENQVLEQRREGQRLLGQLSEREDEVRALVEERDQAKGACLRSQQACKASQAAAEQVQNELAASQTLAETMKTTYLLLEGREHNLAHALGVVCNDVGHRINHLEQCMQTIQVETARAVDRARAARCVESKAKTRLVEIGHENLDLRKLLQAKVEEIVQLQRAKENMLRSQLVAAAEGERERARMHNALVTVQTSHTSLLECNTTLRNTCKQLQADLDSQRSQKSGEAQATSTCTGQVVALDQTKGDAEGIIQVIAASDHITRSDCTLGFKNKGGAIGAHGAPLALAISLGHNCEKKRNAQNLHAEIAILRKEKRMLHHQLADLQMQYDEMAAQVHSAKLEVESMQSEATAAHTDLEVCALEINRLQESLAKERDEKESLVREIQTRGLSEKLDKELQRSTNFGGDGWDANGGPFLRTQSEADSCSSSHQWGDEKASLLLQNAWLRDALRTRGKDDNFGRDHVLLLPASQSVHRSSSVSSDLCALSCEWAEAPVANATAVSDLYIAAGSTIFDRSGSQASGPVALHSDVVVAGVAGKGKDRKRNWGVQKSYAEMFERRSKVVGERKGIEDSVRGIRQPRELASTSPRPPPAAVCAPVAPTAPATELNGGPDSRPPPLPPSKQPSAGPAAGPGEPPVAHYRFF